MVSVVRAGRNSEGEGEKENMMTEQVTLDPGRKASRVVVCHCLGCTLVVVVEGVSWMDKGKEKFKTRDAARSICDQSNI